ncbi:MAG: hypothetical protein ACRDZO_07430 [Egibacteraceae bacterium]
MKRAGRSSAVAAVGTMVAIALVAASVFVVTARLVPAGQAPPERAVEQPPTTLADGGEPGEVPATLPDQVQGTVVGVRTSAGPDAPSCDFTMLGAGDVPTVQGITVTPEVALLEVVTDPPGVGTQRLACVSWRQGGAWSTVTSMTLDEDSGTISNGYFCCTEEGRGVAGAVVQVPEGTRWVLQERAGWWLAYPVGEHLAVPVVWDFRESRFGGTTPASHVLYLDGEGEVLDEAFLRA